MIEVEFVPHRDALKAGEVDKLEVLLRVSIKQDEKANFDRQPVPLNLGIAIDRSGSMAGQPLQEAKRCATHIIERLRPIDRFAVVAYDSVAEVVVPSSPGGIRDQVIQRVEAIEPQGMTALYDGWHLAAAEIAQEMPNGSITRVVLLSDGGANQGLTDTDEITRHCAVMADHGVSTSTYGLGQRFNEDLMSAMARLGQGSAYYGQTADDLMDPFIEELELLEATRARGVRLVLNPESGVGVRNINGYETDAQGRIMLPDLPEEGDVWALLEVSVPRELTSGEAGCPVKLLTALIEYIDLDGQPNVSDPAILQICPLNPDAYAAVETKELVRSRSVELRAAQLQEEARRAARQGDWARVEEIILEIRGMGKENAWILSSLQALETYAQERRAEQFSKEVTYKSRKYRNRIVSRSEDTSRWSHADEGKQPAYLRKKLEQGRRFGSDSEPHADPKFGNQTGRRAIQPKPPHLALLSPEEVKDRREIEQKRRAEEHHKKVQLKKNRDEVRVAWIDRITNMSPSERIRFLSRQDGPFPIDAVPTELIPTPDDLRGVLQAHEIGEIMNLVGKRKGKWGKLRKLRSL
jgi:Ca-activated chloride channel homolog